jgi:hypothetical protein
VADQDSPRTKSSANPKASGAKPSGPKPSVQLGGESLVERLMPHVKKILAGIVVLAVVLTVVFTIRWMKERSRQEGTEKVAKVMDVAQKPIRPMPPVDPTKPPVSPPKADDTSYPSEQARALDMLTALDHSGADATPLYRAAIELSAGKLDDAIADYRKAGAATDYEGVLGREGLGMALEAKATAKDVAADARQKGLEDALAAFVAMQPDEAGPRRAYALYHQGRMLMLLGKKDEAKAVFTKAKDLAKDEIALSQNAARQDPPSQEAGNFLPDLIERRLAALGGS